MARILGVIFALTLLPACGASNSAGKGENEPDAEAQSPGSGGEGNGGTSSHGSGGKGGLTGTGGTTHSGGTTAGQGGQTSVPAMDAGPPPTPTPLPCSQLSASTGWEKITPPGDTGDSQAFGLDPIHPGTIIVQMHKGGNGGHYSTDGLYKSTDCGSTWAKIPPGRNASDPGTNIHSGSATNVIIDPYDSNTIYQVSNYGPGGVWKSTDGGVNWDQKVTNDVGQYVTGLWYNDLAMDPGDHLHLAAVNHEGCTGPYAPNCLTQTLNGGTTWQLNKLPVGWAEGNIVFIKDHNTMSFATNQGGLFTTTDGGGTWAQVGQGATGGVPYLASDGYYYASSSYGIIKSKDFVTWTNIMNGSYRNLIGTGTNLITTYWYSFDYFVAPLTSPGNFTALKVSNTPTTDNGGVYMGYDAAHSLVYTSNYDGGLWRLVQK